MENKTNSLLVSFFGGPGSAKSIMAADVFSKLKWQGRSAELTMEYAKSRVYEKSTWTLENQIYILGKQHHMTFRLYGQVEFVISDSPYLMGIVYDKSRDENLRKLIVSEYFKYNSINFFLERDEKSFEKSGRLQDLEQSIEIDNSIRFLLDEEHISYTSIKSCPENAQVIVEMIKTKYSEIYDSNN